MHILVTLICFDILCIVFNLMIFGFPRLWESYEQKVWPYIIPTVLPLAQIALTGMITISIKNVVGRPSYVLYNFQCNTITYTIVSIISILQSIILRLSLPIILCQIHPKSINIFTYLFIFFRIYLQYLSIGYWAIYISLSSPLCWLSELWNNVYCRLDIIFCFIQYWKIFRIWNTIPWGGK